MHTLLLGCRYLIYNTPDNLKKCETINNGLPPFLNKSCSIFPNNIVFIVLST